MVRRALEDVGLLGVPGLDAAHEPRNELAEAQKKEEDEAEAREHFAADGLATFATNPDMQEASALFVSHAARGLLPKVNDAETRSALAALVIQVRAQPLSFDQRRSCPCLPLGARLAR